MAFIGKEAFVHKTLKNLTSSQLIELLGLMDNPGSRSEFHLASSAFENGVKFVRFYLDDIREIALSGFLCKSSSACGFFGFQENVEEMVCVEIDATNRKTKFIHEGLDAEEFRREVADLLIRGGEGNVTSVNSKTGEVILSASDIKATNSNTIQQNLERIDDELGDLEDNKQARSIVESGSDITIGGLSVPSLTVAQVQKVYNSVVAGDTIVISSHDGSRHIVPLLADSLSGHVSIHFAYYTLMITYWIENDTVYNEYFDMSGANS